MKIHLLSLVATLGMLASSNAITIQTGIGFAVGVVPQAAGSTAVLTTSYQFAVGTFAVEPTAATTFAAALASFSEFTRATVAANAAGGKITAPGTGALAAVSTAATAPTFDNKTMYFFVGNGATLQTSTEWGIMKGSVATPWVFPPDTTGAASTNAIAGTAAAYTAVVGTNIDNPAGFDSFKLVAVPEPTVSLMGLLGTLGFLARRRR